MWLATWLLSLTPLACDLPMPQGNVQLALAPTVPLTQAGETVTATSQPIGGHLALYTMAAPGMPTAELWRFELRPALALDSPCFIEQQPYARYRGLPIAQLPARYAMDTGIVDPAHPPEGADPAMLDEVATAHERVRRATLIGLTVKVLTSVGYGATPPVATACDGEGVPPASCIDDAANARRLAACAAFWADHHGAYEGNDLGLTTPMAGDMYGAVLGLHPISKGPIGGAQVFVNADVATPPLFGLFWQRHDGTGQQFIMASQPVERSRGVRSGPIASPTLASWRGTLAVFANIDEDHVHF